MESLTETYKLQNLITREVTSLSCQDCNQWVWHALFDCLLTAANLAGYIIGGTSSVVWLVGWIIQLAHTSQSSCKYIWVVLWLGLFADVLSLMGAVLSMQIMLLIWNDLVTCIMKICIMTGLALFSTSNFKKHYADADSDMNFYKSLKLLLPKWSCQTVLLVLAFIFILLIVGLANTVNRLYWIELQEYPITLEHFIFLTISGLTIGCFSCVCCLGHEVMQIKLFLMSSTTENVSWRTGCFVQLLSDILFLLGIFLQSNGVQVVIVMLPWIVKRLLQACFCIYKIKCYMWPGFYHNDDDFLDFEQADNKNILDSESTDLLNGYLSDSSDVNVLYDKSWPLVPSICQHQYQQSNNVEQMSLVQKVDCRHDLISTTESDWTSLSQEQEMLCDMIERKKQSKQYQKPFHHLYNTCRHERPPELSLDFTSSIERVKSWISSSTPEEEMPPNLTLTLNLDSVHQNIESGPRFDHRKMYYYNSVLMSPRKNSF